MQLTTMSRARLVVLRSLCAVIFLVGVIFPATLFAQDSAQYGDRLTMTVSPPLFQLGLAPESVWSSTVILHNGGASSIVVRASVENFSADGDSGAAVFAPTGTVSEPTSHELATWVELSDDEYRIPSGGEVRIPFTIRVPKQAEPGGHYAAILIGPSPQSGGGNVSFSSLVSSLLFVKISGNIIEAGEVTGLFPKRAIVQTQDAGFDLRFTNTGNVHLNPEGEIIIFNMFGRERGRIAVDKQHRFGTVLPGASRLFTFEWKGKRNFFDIGRYKVATLLTYGDEQKQTAYKDTHFWVVPWFPIIIIFSTLWFFVWFTRRALRRYIAEAVALEEARLGKHEDTHKVYGARAQTPMLTLGVLQAPLAKGGADLRKLGSREVGGATTKLSYRVFMKRYGTFIGSTGIILIGFLLIGWYFFQVFTAERDYQMLIKKSGSSDIVVGDSGL